MSTITLNAAARQNIGKGASRRLRREQDQVPAIVYGAGQTPTPITLDHNTLLKTLENHAFYSSILTLAIDGKEESVVLKDLQRHAYKPKVLHMDFQRIRENEKIHMTVPLHFINEAAAPGVKAGGMISHLLTEVEIRCFPRNLPEFINVDMSAIELDQTLHLSDLKISEGIELVGLSHGDDAAIVNIHVLKAVAETTEAPVAPVTEVINEKVKEEKKDEKK